MNVSKKKVFTRFCKVCLAATAQAYAEYFLEDCILHAVSCQKKQLEAPHFPSKMRYFLPHQFNGATKKTQPNIHQTVAICGGFFHNG